MDTRYASIDPPVGPLWLVTDGTHLTGLHFSTGKQAWEPPEGAIHEPLHPILVEAGLQLSAYFRGERTSFDLPLHPVGTDFQRAVWNQLSLIPFGTTISYGELARRVGNPNASRAVGLANGRNPIAIIIPCHRVIGANGSLTGFGGGTDCKRTLLDLERAGLFATA